MLVLISCLVMYFLLAKGTLCKFMPQSAYFQFFINPSTIFIVGGMLVAKYGDGPITKTGVTTDDRLLSNHSMPKTITAGRNFGEEHYGVQNQSIPELYNTMDPINLLEIRLITFIIQDYDNSSQWMLKFVDLPPHFVASQQRKANVLITDANERQPIWVVVNLSTAKVDQWVKGKRGAGRQLSEEETELAGRTALTDGEVQEKIQVFTSKGLAGFEVVPDVWDAGTAPNTPNKDKLVQVYFFAVRQQTSEELFAYPCNFLAYVQLGGRANMTVRDVKSIPLHQHTDTDHTPYSHVHPGAAILPPNTIRRNRYRLAKGEKSSSSSGFSFSSLAELRR